MHCISTHSPIPLLGSRRSKVPPPPPPPPRPEAPRPTPPPKETAAPASAQENEPSPVPPLPRTSLIRDIDQELRDGAESFVQEDDIVPALSPACAAAAFFELLSANDFDGPTGVLPPTSLANVPTPCKKGTAETCRATIASKEAEARTRLAALSCSVVSAEKAVADMENESELEAERAAAKQKREEERRNTEIMFTNAATVIQAAARRHSVRSAYNRIRAATVIQSAARRHCARSAYIRVRAATVIIQSAVRRHCARSAYIRVRAATISLQAFARQCLAKNKQYRNRAYINSTATKIQALARGVHTRRQVQAELASIVFLQAFARGTMVRNRKKACDMAITPFQALVRGRIDRNRVKVIKWHSINKRPYRKSSNARKLSVSFGPSSPVAIDESPDVTMSGDLINIFLDASQGSEGAKDRAIAAKKVLIRNTSLYVSYVNALISAKIEVGGNSETILSNSTSIEAVVNELVCFLAMLAQDIRRVFIPSAKIHSAHSVLVENCPKLYAELCRALGCKSGYIPTVDEYFHHADSLGDEDLKVRYELTRTTYAVLFKSKPPVEFWPAPSTPDCSNVGVSFEKVDEKFHLSFLNEDNLHDDDDNDDDSFNDEYYDEEESVDVGTNIFDMNTGVLVRELQYLVEDPQSIGKVVDELRNVGLMVGETVKKSALMSFFDS